MKKILAIFLALVMILSIALVSCAKDKATTGGNSDDADDEDDIFVQNSKDKETSDTDKENNKTGGWEAAAYPIYCMATGLNVRSSDSTSSDKLGALNIGDKLDATERNDDWYKVTYNGVTAYVAREYVTASANEAIFTNDATPTKLILAKNHETDKANLRVMPVVVEDTSAITYNEGDNKGTLTKIGQNAEGNWYVVEYDADGEGATAPVVYYLKMNSETKAMFGLASSAGGYS